MDLLKGKGTHTTVRIIFGLMLIIFGLNGIKNNRNN